MEDAIRSDMASEVQEVVRLLQATFDVQAYPALADGPTFDRRVVALDAALARLKLRFNDYLVNAWSQEITAAVAAVQANRGNRSSS